MTPTALHDSPPSPGGGWRLRRSGPAPAVASARAVTRVESTTTTGNHKAKIDWLNATFERPAMSREGLLAFLSECCAGPISARLDGGLFGFTERWRLAVHLDDGQPVEVGALCLGGESQKGKWLLQFTGRGCGLVKDWASLQELLEGLGAALSRTDLAVDFLDGEHTVDDAVDLYEAGAFINRGRNPEFDAQGAWNEAGVKGRTVYVGKLKNGKALCVYEKGKQLGDLASPHTRFEVRLGNRDRVIPLDILTNPDKYFVGAYPALADLLESAAEEIPTLHAEAKTSIAHALHHLRRCYGKHIHAAQVATGVAAADLVEEVVIMDMPSRVDPASGRAGLVWPELQAQMQRMRQ